MGLITQDPDIDRFFALFYPLYLYSVPTFRSYLYAVNSQICNLNPASSNLRPSTYSNTSHSIIHKYSQSNVQSSVFKGAPYTRRTLLTSCHVAQDGCVSAPSETLSLLYIQLTTVVYNSWATLLLQPMLQFPNYLFKLPHVWLTLKHSSGHVTPCSKTFRGFSFSLTLASKAVQSS